MWNLKKLRALLGSLRKSPAKEGKELEEKQGQKHKFFKALKPARIIFGLYLLGVLAVAAAYFFRGPLGEIIIKADPLPFNLQEEESGEPEEEETLGEKEMPSEPADPIEEETKAEQESSQEGDTKETYQEDDTKEAVAFAAGAFNWPVKGEVLVRHGEMFRVENQLRPHTGIDIKARQGSEVKAVWSGNVKETGISLLLGHYVLLNHDEGFLTYYANLDKIFVKEGATVQVGESIGTVGKSAVLDAATGEYLHFSLYRTEAEVSTGPREIPLDPLEYLDN
ncbi:MAG TPA: M23 family metallopeptidase [Firmicutes bacterium]|nr:M23 family metallopeptidase [Bacillota bacterium]